MKNLFLVVIIVFTVSGYAYSDVESQDKSLSPIEKSKQSPALPIVLNILPGFGIGSYIQGDTQAGNIILVGDLIAAGMLVGGGLSYYFNNKNSESLIEPIVCFSTGGLLYLGMKIFGFVKPLQYVKNGGNVKLMSNGNNIVLSCSF